MLWFQGTERFKARQHQRIDKLLLPGHLNGAFHPLALKDLRIATRKLSANDIPCIPPTSTIERSWLTRARSNRKHFLPNHYGMWLARVCPWFSSRFGRDESLLVEFHFQQISDTQNSRRSVVHQANISPSYNGTCIPHRHTRHVFKLTTRACFLICSFSTIENHPAPLRLALRNIWETSPPAHARLLRCSFIETSHA